MDVVILIAITIVVVALAGWLAGPIWTGKHPIGLLGDYLAKKG